MRGILYLDRETLYYYGGNVHAVLSLTFPQTAVKDMEIIDETAIEKLIDLFVHNNKIEPSEVLIVFSHRSCFSKLLPPNTLPEAVEHETKTFLEFVPFNRIASKTIRTTKGLLIVATNKDIINVLKHTFQKHAFIYAGASTLYSLYPDNPISVLNIPIAQQILRSFNHLREENIVSEQSVLAPEAALEQEFAKDDKKETNNRLYFMVGFFVVGLLILGYMLYAQSVRRSTPRRIVLSPIPTRPPQTTAVSAAEPTQTQATVGAILSPTSIPKSPITIRILNGSGTAGKADEIRSALIGAGFQDGNVTIGNAPTSQSTTTRIVFKTNVAQSIRQEVSDIVSRYVRNVSSIQNDEIEFDILITTAPS